MPDLSSYRAKFSSLNNCHHLISNSLGAVPDRALDYAQDYIETWSRLGVRAWREWWPLSREVGDQVGAIIGAAPDTVTMLPNVTSASAVVQSCFDLVAPRNKIVMVDMEFPSILYVYQEWARDHGRVEMIASEDGVTVSTEKIIDSIDETTLLVPISHVFFRSSYIIEIEKIIEKAHSVGAYVVLDAFQSVGTVPIDVQKL
ncbi:MAG: aminotransferase class V-fold PLP-dependent enzyme, partial [candidate division Zixibacteria bacterium]|nr:aminotransferase class V-fold PLP-dependent enzyme [candidate division Zixibacteria bacterium]